MPFFETRTLNQSSVGRIYGERERINLAPEYQRTSDLWNLEKKQLLIDSIINDYDIPKLYFHYLRRFPDNKSDDFDYAVIDGKQRLSAIWEFIEGKYVLASEFEFLHDSDVKAGSLSYAELGAKFPRLKSRFDSFSLPIVLVETDDLELIDDLFSRLNEAVPLKAPEKRNAIGGAVIEKVRSLVTHSFFSNRIRFGNRRFQHHEVATKLLFIEASYASRLYDTKKIMLDKFVKDFSNKVDEIDEFYQTTLDILDGLAGKFIDKDPLLAAQGTIAVYYLCFRSAQLNREDKKFNRDAVRRFRDSVQENRTLAERDISFADYSLIEYDNMSRQGTNDVGSITSRTRIMCKHLAITPHLPPTE